MSELLLLSFSWVALVVGLLLGYIIGLRMARNMERHHHVKDKINNNTLALYLYQKEKSDYIEQINRLETDLHHLTEASELYQERVAERDYYQRRLRESEQIIERLTAVSEETVDLSENAFTLLVQLKQDPVHTNPTKLEWAELLRITNLLFNNILVELKTQYAITPHEEEICCLMKWNFSRQEQMAIFNNTSEAYTKSKSRLKKRLQLDEKNDVEQFIRLY